MAKNHDSQWDRKNIIIIIIITNIIDSIFIIIIVKFCTYHNEFSFALGET